MAECEQNIEEKISEDTRFSLLTDALNQTSLKIVNKILSQKALADCLPFMKKKPDTLAQLHATLSEKIQSRLKDDIDELITDLDLKNKLDLLDQLDVEQAELSKGESVWRPTGNPSKDLLAYDMPTLQQHKEELLASLKELQDENEREKKKVLKVVDGIEETEKLVEDILTNNEKALEALTNIPCL